MQTATYKLKIRPKAPAPPGPLSSPSSLGNEKERVKGGGSDRFSYNNETVSSVK